MNFEWLKRAMPRGLYGRAALILFLPVVVVTVVVTVMFLQRHFEDVTRQMTSGMASEIALVAARIDAAPDIAAARDSARQIAGPLGLDLVLPAAEEGADDHVFYDLSGRIVIAELHDRLPEVRAVDLGLRREVRVTLHGRWGPYQLVFPRVRVSASNPHQLLVLMVGTSLLMTAIATIFLRNQLRPIRRLARAAEEYGKGRIIPYRPAGASEIRSAGTAFLEMRARIERQNEQRKQMLSGVSHDLRTPLTRLRLGLSMLSPDYPPEPGEIAALEGDVAAMGTMVDAFLDHARDAAQDAPPQSVPALDFLRSIVADAQRGGQAVRLHELTGDEAGRATFSRDSLRRAIENLIGNAVRYGERAEVDAALGPSYFRISIEDDGPGIPPEKREEALKPFTRLDPARNQNQGQGVGLGLAIAADIARAHGGQLRLGEGERLGGLRAEIVIPR
ncbi:two-component system, OmpR family, osmolarity sensor histidine kinase EnvZ [Paracoccus aminovorans]|uniref:histidine kinase n=1 Tax=Paracoccus aminovorans TaxID=34004 RepID=A0A1I3CSA1_9RHOB|nr:ATP-binding protein [Paracoccus aminovorans]CQR85894.1 two-component system, OmpR family, osmolarity sensor histidine kinase [Paracoccus aminovorans]SFH77303.1 two-component system, OmpR family, osmolarity sensor histidine kinase EnvZ [Paracoccus aminovorans]